MKAQIPVILIECEPKEANFFYSQALGLKPYSINMGLVKGPGKYLKLDDKQTIKGAYLRDEVLEVVRQAFYDSKVLPYSPEPERWLTRYDLNKTKETKHESNSKERL